MKKRSLAVFLCAVMLLALAAGCAKKKQGAEYVGLWNATSSIVNGEKEFDFPEGDTYLKLAEDRKAELCYKGRLWPDCSWEPIQNGVLLTVVSDGGSSLYEFKLRDPDTLAMYGHETDSDGDGQPDENYIAFERAKD